MLSVKNLCSPSSGREIANQFEISLNGASVFQSYQSIVAIWTNGRKIINQRYYKYSPTTTKYTSQFFNCNGAKDLHDDVFVGNIEVISDEEFTKLLKQIEGGNNG